MRHKLPRVSAVSLSLGLVAVLMVVYVGLIAVVMSYAASTIEFSQSVRTDESSVAALEAKYLDAIAHIMATDYTAADYAPPVKTVFVKAASATALR